MGLQVNVISLFFVFAIGIIYLGFVQSWYRDMELTGISNSNKGLLLTGLKITRMNKTMYGESGWFTITEDFSDAYNFVMRAYYSRIGNNQYVMLPFKYSMPLCSMVEGMYRKRYAKTFEKYSNIPKQVVGKPLCPLYVKGNYSMRNYPFSPVRQVFQVGLYKFELLFQKKKSSEFDSKIIVHIKLS